MKTACTNCGLIGEGEFCSNCGKPLPRRPANAGKDELTKSLGVISEPLSDYWKGLSRWNRLDELAAFIKSMQPMSADLIKYVLGSTLVTTVIARIIRYDEGSLEFVDVPVANEIMAVCLFLIVGFITSLVVHRPLKFVGGKGAFRHTFLSATYVGVTFLPFIMLMEGMYSHVTGQKLPSAAYGGTQLVYLAMLLGKIHEISYGKALALIGSLPLALLAVGVAMVLLFS